MTQECQYLKQTASISALKEQLCSVRRMEYMVAHRHYVYGLSTGMWVMMYLGSVLFFHSTFLKLSVSVNTSFLISGILNAVIIFIIFKSHKNMAENQWEVDFKRLFSHYRAISLNRAATDCLTHFIDGCESIPPEHIRIWCCAEKTSLKEEIHRLGKKK